MTIGTGDRSRMLQAFVRHCGQDSIGPSEVEDQSKVAIRHAVLPPPERNGYSEFKELILLLLPDPQRWRRGFDWTQAISLECLAQIVGKSNASWQNVIS